MFRGVNFKRRSKKISTVVISNTPKAPAAKFGVAGFNGKVNIRFQGEMLDWMKEVAATINN